MPYKNIQDAIAFSKRYRLRNKERLKKKDAEYYQKNKEKHNERSEEWRKANRGWYSEYWRKWRGKNKEATKRYQEKWLSTNLHKRRAHYDLRNAIRRGEMKRLPCSVCGSLKSQGHHSDYSKPLDVIWLCPQHHKEAHHAQRL